MRSGLCRSLSGLSLVIAANAVAVPSVDAADVNLTFFGWSDQHVRTDGSVTAATTSAVAAMKNLPGAPYPATIGGSVASPSFVFGAGDITEWPTHAALTAYQNLQATLGYPTYDMAGNHDDGGQVPSPTVLNWLTSKHGGLSYTFQQGGVHFIAAHSAFDAFNPNPAQPISDDAIAFIQTSISQVPQGEPVVVATHQDFTSITNPDALVDAFGDANVIMVMSGHYHQPEVNTYRGINFLQLPSPESSIHAVTAVRITSDRLTAIPYNCDTSTWMSGNVVLDVPIQVPEPASLCFLAVGGLALLGRRRG